MEPWLKQFKKTCHEVTFEPERKAAVRAQLIGQLALDARARTAQPWWYLFARPTALVSTFAILVFMGGSLSAAAEQTVPGDALYSVKVKFNEEVRKALSITPEAQADWAMQRAARRLDEADVLEEQGKLNVEMKHELAADFETHADEVQAVMGKMEDKEPARALGLAQNFENILKNKRRRNIGVPTVMKLATPSEEQASPVVPSDTTETAPAAAAMPLTAPSPTEDVKATAPVPTPLRRVVRPVREVESQRAGFVAPRVLMDTSTTSTVSGAGEIVAPSDDADNEEEIDRAVRKTLDRMRQTKVRLENRDWRQFERGR